MLPKVKEKASL